MSQSHLINKDSINSVPWEKNVIYCWNGLNAAFLWNCFCCWERSNLPLPYNCPGYPCSPEVPVLGVSLRFKRAGIFGKKMGSELRRDFLHDPGNFGATTLQAAGRGAANSSAPSSVQSVSSCQRASPVFVVSSPVCKGRTTAFCCGRGCRGSGFGLKVCCVPQSRIS